jgi:hypothetical protein
MLFSQLHHVGGVQGRIVIEHDDNITVLGLYFDLIFLGEYASYDKTGKECKECFFHLSIVVY